MNPIQVNTERDWDRVCEAGLSTVLDPLTIRTAEAFLGGATGTAGDAQTWNAISMNVDALRTFIDTMMLQDRLPVFDYGATWETGLRGITAGFSEACNVDEEVLVDVHVGGDAYVAARTPAIDILRGLPDIEPALAASIEQELSAFDHRWRPALPELGPLDERDAAIAAFRYGGLLFHGYAEEISAGRFPLLPQGEHVLHDKRARVLLARSLDPSGSLGLAPDPLLDRLRRVERAMGDGVASIDMTEPTFLPLLLSRNPASPRAMLADALSLRRTRLVRAYREWRGEVLECLEDGRIPRREIRELRAIAEEVSRRARSAPVVSTHAILRLAVAGLTTLITQDPRPLAVALGAADGVDVEAIRFRLASLLPGRHHIRILTRMVTAQSDYFAIDKSLGVLWRAGR